ncbi:MAG: hypothetical protein ACK4KT_02255 [Thermaurantimonas sp.]
MMKIDEIFWFPTVRYGRCIHPQQGSPLEYSALKSIRLDHYIVLSDIAMGPTNAQDSCSHTPEIGPNEQIRKLSHTRIPACLYMYVFVYQPFLVAV